MYRHFVVSNGKWILMCVSNKKKTNVILSDMPFPVVQGMSRKSLRNVKGLFLRQKNSRQFCRDSATHHVQT